MAYIHISDLELAINYWRQHEPSVDGISLPGHTRVLAEIYAHMVYSRVTRVDEICARSGVISMAPLVRHHPRHPLHCYLFHQPG